MGTKFEIDQETADRITVLNLKQYLKFLENELVEHHKGDTLHPEDVVSSIKAIDCLKFIISHYE
jgi:hypothetical protein